jgi:hypothetical protein
MQLFAYAASSTKHLDWAEQQYAPFSLLMLDHSCFPTIAHYLSYQCVGGFYLIGQFFGFGG